MTKYLMNGGKLKVNGLSFICRNLLMIGGYKNSNHTLHNHEKVFNFSICSIIDRGPHYFLQQWA